MVLSFSDGGGQYMDTEFRLWLNDYPASQSMTRKDNHYDNAHAESLFSRFKAELMQQGLFVDFDDAQTAIFEYIEIYYGATLHQAKGMTIALEGILHWGIYPLKILKKNLSRFKILCLTLMWTKQVKGLHCRRAKFPNFRSSLSRNLIF